MKWSWRDESQPARGVIDIQLLRTNLEGVAARLHARGFAFPREAFLALESKRKQMQMATQELQAERNSQAKLIGQAKARGEDTSALMSRSEQINMMLVVKESDLAEIQARLQVLLDGIPNLPHESVPQGDGPEQNAEQRRWGAPRAFDFQVKDHVDVGAALGGLDFDTAIKLAGARFAVMKGGVARLHRALAQFMLDVHTEEHGYTEVYVPYMVSGECANGVSSLAKFKDDLFKLEGRDLYLIPTAEYPVTNFVRETIVPLESLPLKYVCH